MTELDHAVALLAAGELVAFPTETVYGLGADAGNPAAVAKIFAAKGRPADHPVIVHVPGAAHLENWAQDIPQLAWDLAEAFWPGPLTLILKRRPGVPDLVTGGQDSVGLRVPGHPLALDLLRAFAASGAGDGLAAPSANRFGRISPTTAAHVRAELGDRVRLVLDGGACPVGIESTIIDLSRGAPVLLRPGHLRPDQIEAVVGVPVAAPDTTPPAAAAAPRVSGALAAHYAPVTPLVRIAGEGLAEALAEASRVGEPVAVLARRPSPPDAALPAGHWCTLGDDPVRYAHDLYAALRALDDLGVRRILLEAVPVTAAWAAVADRLRRATAGSGPG